MMLRKKRKYSESVHKHMEGNVCMNGVEAYITDKKFAGSGLCGEGLDQDRRYCLLCRVRDVGLSGFALLVLWPFLLLVAAIIVLDSPGGGPIFAQTRIGKDGKPFTLYKFRTMRPNAERELEGLLPYNEMDGPVFKIRKDPRITRFGSILRRCCIDELPQLWNVLRGDMSLVGPRPALPREVAQYDAYTRQRLQVLPGLTCYWQIQPDRNQLPFHQWLALDLQYIQDQNMITDWLIIWKTCGAVLRMNGE